MYESSMKSPYLHSHVPIENVVASKVDDLTNESIVLSSMKTGPVVGLTFSWATSELF